jgi:hypothetical protein
MVDTWCWKKCRSVRLYMTRRVLQSEGLKEEGGYSVLKEWIGLVIEALIV